MILLAFFIIWLLYQCFLWLTPSNIQNKRNSSLLIIEWDEDSLRQNNIRKNIVVDFIREFPGCFQLVQNQSESIFYFVDTPRIQASHVIDNIVLALQRAYHQKIWIHLEKYIVIAEEENLFKSK